MKASEKRLQIAKDILKHIKSYKLYPVTGDFYFRISSLEKEKSAQKYLQSVTNCSVCAKGAVVVSYILRHNKITSKTLFDIDQVVQDWPKEMSGLLRIFTRKMLDEIEILYERRRYYWSDIHAGDVIRLIDYSNSKLKDTPQERLIQIIELLIKNKGKKIVL